MVSLSEFLRKDIGVKRLTMFQSLKGDVASEGNID